MRADRLLSLLMLLQTRGRMTASQLSEVLNVSERTVYRDIDALSTAGVPVYAEAGQGGGFELLEHYRTNLTGLNAAEARALFLFNTLLLDVPTPLEALGLDQDLQSALLKLTAALPDSRMQVEARRGQRIYLDWTGWTRVNEAAPFLRIVHRAVMDDRVLKIRYLQEYGFELELPEAKVEPYGLVAKSGTWYLVAVRAGQLRVLHLERILDAQLEVDHFERPAEFNLADYWRCWLAETEQQRASFCVEVRLAPEIQNRIGRYFGKSVQLAVQTAPGDRDGWKTAELFFESFEAARARLLEYGGAVEVLEPLALRLSIVDYAVQTVSIYARRPQ